MHAVAPVIRHDGRDIDALGVGIRIAEILIYGQQILEWENHPHRWGFDISQNLTCKNNKFTTL